VGDLTLVTAVSMPASTTPQFLFSLSLLTAHPHPSRILSFLLPRNFFSSSVALRSKYPPPCLAAHLLPSRLGQHAVLREEKRVTREGVFPQ
jgi:hypothetical protein